MKTLLDEENVKIGTTVKCLKDCKDISNKESYKKDSLYIVSHWFTHNDNTFGTTHSTQCTKKEYFTLDITKSYYFY